VFGVACHVIVSPLSGYHGHRGAIKLTCHGWLASFDSEKLPAAAVRYSARFGPSGRLLQADGVFKP
jgi:hypothetical protein